MPLTFAQVSPVAIFQSPKKQIELEFSRINLVSTGDLKNWRRISSSILDHHYI